MKYFIEWHSKRFHHNYRSPIEAESIETAKAKFFKIHGDDAVVLSISVQLNTVPVDNLGPQKGVSEGIER